MEYFEYGIAVLVIPR